MIVVFKYLVPKGFVGITIWPFIILRHHSSKLNLVTINHEKIHLRQQIQLFVFMFYFLYIIEYVFNLIRYKNPLIAYRGISFEREAYANESNLEYLKTFTFWQFLKYYK